MSHPSRPPGPPPAFTREEPTDPDLPAHPCPACLVDGTPINDCPVCEGKGAINATALRSFKSHHPDRATPLHPPPKSTKK